MEQLKTPFLFHDINLKIPDYIYPPEEDTELILDNIKITKNDTILDIGTGSAVISIFCAKKTKNVVASDISDEILKIAEKNAKLNNIDHIKFVKSNLFENIDNKFSKIIFNPPYLPADQKDQSKIKYSLESGENGRDITDEFIKNVKSYITPEGTIYLVQSSLTNYEKTILELEKLGFEVKIKASKNFFFEEIVLIEIRMR